MYFTSGKDRAFEMLMQGKPGFDRYENGCAEREDCNTCRFYRPCWKYQFYQKKKNQLLMYQVPIPFLSFPLTPFP